MVKEMKDYIIKYSRDEDEVLKMAENVVRIYNLSENKQKLIVHMLYYCGVSISEKDDILRNAITDSCIGSIEDICFYIMVCIGIVMNDKLKDVLHYNFDFNKFLNSTECEGFVIFDLGNKVFGVVAKKDL